MSALTWTTVDVFGGSSLAQEAGSALTSAGIPFRITADDASRLGPPRDTRAGFHLQVPVEHDEDARAVLSVHDTLRTPASTATDLVPSLMVDDSTHMMVRAVMAIVVVAVVASEILGRIL